MTLSGRLTVTVILLGLVTTFAPRSHGQAEGIRAGTAKILVTAPASSIGAGIVVRRDADEAYIVTAAHVVSGADKIVVQFYGAARSWPAEVKNIETENLAQGLALIRVAGALPAEVRALPLAAEVNMLGGEQVIMIGHQPSTGDWGVLSGIVSGRKGREVVIQAPIQERASGGPVVFTGRVVGLVQRQDPTQAFGYAVTAQAIREYVEGLQIALAPLLATAPGAGKGAPSPVTGSPPTAKSPPAETRQVVINGPKPLYAPFKTGDVFQECAECPEMVVITAGSFQMGGYLFDDEKPVHRVTLAAFAIGKTEVTQGQWRALMGSNPSSFKGCGDDCPVESVGWNDAKDYIERLNAKTGKRYRLPSEAEWEYACRAGGRQGYCGSGSYSVDSVAWYESNSGSKTHAVAGKQANAFGLYDMSGNVWEWVEDCWHDNYKSAPEDGSAWTAGRCDLRVLRGGSWDSGELLVRSTSRISNARAVRGIGSGFRSARMLP